MFVEFYLNDFRTDEHCRAILNHLLNLKPNHGWFSGYICVQPRKQVHEMMYYHYTAIPTGENSYGTGITP